MKPVAAEEVLLSQVPQPTCFWTSQSQAGTLSIPYPSGQVPHPTVDSWGTLAYPGALERCKCTNNALSNSSRSEYVYCSALACFDMCHACKGIKALGLVQCAMHAGEEVQSCKEVKHILSRRSRYPPTFISQSPTHHGCQSCKRYVWTIMDHDNYGPSTTYDSSKLDNPDMMRCRKL